MLPSVNFPHEEQGIVYLVVSHAKILLIASDAVINLALTYLFNSSSSFVFCSCDSPFAGIIVTLAMSGPLYTYLYKYLQDFTLVYISALMCALYFLLRYGLHGTTNLLSNRIPFFSMLFHHSATCNVDIHCLSKFFPQTLLEISPILHAGWCWITHTTWSMHHILCNSGNLYSSGILAQTMLSVSSMVLGLYLNHKFPKCEHVEDLFSAIQLHISWQPSCQGCM